MWWFFENNSCEVRESNWTGHKVNILDWIDNSDDFLFLDILKGHDALIGYDDIFLNFDPGDNAQTWAEGEEGLIFNVVTFVILVIGVDVLIDEGDGHEVVAGLWVQKGKTGIIHAGGISWGIASSEVDLNLAINFWGAFSD